MTFPKLLILLLLAVRDNLSVAADSAGCRNGILYPGNAADEYYYCVNGALKFSQCPSGSYFDVHFLVCRHGTPPDDDVAAEAGKCQRIGMTADLTDCSRFYYCSAKNDNMEHGSCRPGQIFDLSKYTCVVGKC